MTNAERIHEITAAVNRCFPEFEIPEDMEELLTVMFVFLTDQLVWLFRTGNTSAVTSFINLRSCLDELVMGLYSEAEDVYPGFKRQLPAEASASFSTTIHLWTLGKQMNPTDRVYGIT